MNKHVLGLAFSSFMCGALIFSYISSSGQRDYIQEKEQQIYQLQREKEGLTKEVLQLRKNLLARPEAQPTTQPAQ